MMIMKICCCHSSLFQAGTCKKSIADISVLPMTFHHHSQKTSAVFPADLSSFHRHFHQFFSSMGTIRIDLYHTNRCISFLKRSIHLKILQKNLRKLYTPVKICRKFICGSRQRQLRFILCINRNTIFEYSFRFKNGRIFKQHKVRKFSRCDSSSVIKMHPLTWCICGTVDCLFHRKSHIDRFLYHCIQRSLLIQNICHSIICYKGTILVELVLADIFQDFRFQHFILDLKKHSVFDPLLYFLKSMFCMITINTQIKKLCKIQIQ